MHHTIYPVSMKYILMFCCILFMRPAYSQLPTGTYYGFYSKNRLEKVVISPGKIERSITDTAFNIVDNAGGYTSELDTVIYTGNTFYLVQPADEATGSYHVGVVRTSGNNITLAATGFELPLYTLNDVKQYIRNDTLPQFYRTFYTEQNLLAFKKLKNIATITRDDFKTFAEGVMADRWRRNAVYDMIPGGLKRDYQTSRMYEVDLFKQILINLGYNPFCTSEEFESLKQKYAHDPGLKELLKKL